MKLFELRACWTEVYNDPDDGLVNVCDTYETVAFAKEPGKLQKMTDELNSGFKDNVWSAKRAAELRKLHPGFDNYKDVTYKVTEVTHLLKK